MKTKTIQLFDFEELSEDAKEKALNRHNENNEHDYLSEDLNEYLSQLLTENKINSDDAKLYYSLGYCQGDGVCFEGNFEYQGVRFNVKHQGNYYHSNSVNIEMEDNEDSDDDLKNDLIEVISEKAEDNFKEVYKEICDKIEKSGYEIIDYEQSEEAFKELCDANEYTFRENGEIEN